MKHEGLRLDPYLDSVGKLTIGYGRNIDDNGIRQNEAEYMLAGDVAEVREELNRHFDWYSTLDTVRQAVIENMLFNMGLNKFMGFKNMIAALQLHDFQQAASEMRDSHWYQQVGTRARELVKMMRTGEEIDV